MGLFKKGNGGTPKASEAGTEGEPAPKKRKSELAKVLDESVWESVNEDFKKNKQFIIKDDDGDVTYVALLFDTTTIGGLADKASRKDESKGSIIEAIKTGRIKTYIRTEMLMDDCFIIIPDADTITNMDEFRILLDVKYVLCKVSPDGNVMTVTETDNDDSDEVTVTFAQVRSLIENDGDVKELFPSSGPKNNVFNGDDVEYDDVEELDEDSEDSDDGEDIEDLPDSYDEEPDEYEAVNSQMDEPLEPEQEPEPEPVVQQATPAPTVVKPTPISKPEPVQQPVVQSAPTPTPVQVQPASEPVQQAVSPYAQYVQEEEQFDFGVSGEDETYSDYEGSDDYYEDDDVDITEDVVNNFVVRNFYSDDLGLEISTQPFDAQFTHGNPYLPFDEHRGPGWLNEQLSNIAKDGNTRMERLHSENLFRLRERYMRLVQAHCENISKSLDVSDEKTEYGKLRFAIEQNRTDNMESIRESIQPKVKQLEDSWKERLNTVGEKAKADAIEKFIDRYGKTHERDIASVESREKDEIERDYQNAMKRMNDDRRAEATKLLDIAINNTLKDMSTIYLKVLQEEKKEYVRIQNQMTRFIDENRKNEVARIEALAEENRQSNKAAAVRKEYTAKIKAMAAEFEARTSDLQADVNKMRIDHENELRLYKSEWEDKLDEEKAKTAAVQKQLDDLLDKYAAIDGQKTAEYADRVARLQTENESYKDELEHMIDVHKRSNKMYVYLVVAIMIAFLGIGFMVGSILDINRNADYQQSAVTSTQQTQTDEDAVNAYYNNNGTYTNGVDNDDLTNAVINPSLNN